jgi:HIRAN domain
MSERLRLWLERGERGYHLRDAATGEPVRWEDERVLVVPVAGASYRMEAMQDDAFAPPSAVALVPEPENEHDPNAIAIWDAERRVQAGYVPAEFAPHVPRDAQALALWEFRDEEGRRVGLRVLVAPSSAWIGRPRS